MTVVLWCRDDVESDLLKAANNKFTILMVSACNDFGWDQLSGKTELVISMTLLLQHSVT